MDIGEITSIKYEAQHIDLTLGNILTIGILSLLFYGGTDWVTNWAARTELPLISQLAVGAQNFLHPMA